MGATASVCHITLRQCETHSQCVSLAPPREPSKLSLLHSIVFHIALRSAREIAAIFRIHFLLVVQTIFHVLLRSTRKIAAVFKCTFFKDVSRACEIPQSIIRALQSSFFMDTLTVGTEANSYHILYVKTLIVRVCLNRYRIGISHALNYEYKRKIQQSKWRIHQDRPGVKNLFALNETRFRGMFKVADYESELDRKHKKWRIQYSVSKYQKMIWFEQNSVLGDFCGRGLRI